MGFVFQEDIDDLVQAAHMGSVGADGVNNNSNKVGRPQPEKTGDVEFFNVQGILKYNVLVR